jgi:hypothetical protein
MILRVSEQSADLRKNALLAVWAPPRPVVKGVPCRPRATT